MSENPTHLGIPARGLANPTHLPSWDRFFSKTDTRFRKPDTLVAWHGIASLLMRLPRLLLLPTFSPPPRRAMAALAALLAHLPDTVLEQFRDASFTANFRIRNAQLFSGTSWVDLDDLLAWLRQRGDMDLLDLDSIFPFDPRSMDGADVSIQNAAFDGYPAVGFDDTRAATPSSGYSYPYDDYQSSNYSVPASEFDYLDASGSSTPYSGLDLFGENYESNLDWDPSLAAFFDSAKLSFNLDTPFVPAVASGSDASFFLRDPAPSHLQAADPAVFLSPPQDNFKFEDGNLRLMTQEEMDAAGEAWQWAPSSTVWLDKDVLSDVGGIDPSISVFLKSHKYRNSHAGKRNFAPM
ncbi:hypothetical protein B0H11DRAFT_2201668 [Mycena galericulata]|nr:hypothetical protein B0H11DRAFT_2201668 [Mycena galericulata]